MRNIRTPEEDRTGREATLTYKWGCPVDGCYWSHAFVCEGIKERDFIALSLDGSVSIAATKEQNETIEAGFATIRKHLESHSDEELAGVEESKP